MNFLTVRQAAEKYGAFTEASLRWIIFNSKTNGATSFIRKVGRKVLIEESGFVQWIDNQREVLSGNNHRTQRQNKNNL